MFQYYDYKTKYVNNFDYRLHIIIYDTDFIYSGEYCSKYFSDGRYAATKAIIDCYSKKNLNVALNLYLFFKLQIDYNFSIPYILEDTPEVALYLEKINKYKLLE